MEKSGIFFPNYLDNSVKYSVIIFYVELLDMTNTTRIDQNLYSLCLIKDIFRSVYNYILERAVDRVPSQIPTLKFLTPPSTT